MEGVVWLVLLASLCELVGGFRSITRGLELSRSRYGRLGCSSLDPLEYVKGGDDDDPRGRRRGSRRLKNGENGDGGDEVMRKIEYQALRADNAYVQELLQTIEADMLQSLPEEMMESFQSYLVQLLPRVSIMSLVIHLMLLIPALRYVKLELHQSIYPYLYLGPLMLVLPFAVFFFGEKKLYEQPFMAQKVETYLSVQKDLAAEFIREQEERTLAILDELLRERNPDEREAERVVRNIALARLMSRVDVEFLAREVLVAKRSRLGLWESDDPALSLVSSPSSSSPVPASVSVSSRLGAAVGERRTGVAVSPFFSSLEGGGPEEAPNPASSSESGSTIQAAFRLIDNLRRAEDGRVRSDQECLRELRALQQQVELVEGE